MADKVDVKFKSIDQSGTTSTTTISYINPEATNSEMKGFAQRLNALTTNTYKESDKVETTNLDNAPDSKELITPTFTLDKTSVSYSSLKTGYVSLLCTSGVTQLTYNGDGIPYAYYTEKSDSNPDNQPSYCGLGVFKDGTKENTWNIAIFGAADRLAIGKILVRVDATDNYKAATATLEIIE